MKSASVITDFAADVTRYEADLFPGTRLWLDREVERFVADADRRHLVIVGEPGSGKSTYVGHLAAKYACARYFATPVQGPDSRLAGSVADVLVRLGRQLGERYGTGIFGRALEIQGTVSVAAGTGAGEAVGVSVDELYLSPFLQLVVAGTVHAGELSGGASVAGVRIRRLYTDASQMDPVQLLREAITDPLASIAETLPSERVLIVIDGLDRFVNGGGQPSLSDLIPTAINLRVVMTSRRGPHLARFRTRDQLALIGEGESWQGQSEAASANDNQADIRAYVDHVVNDNANIKAAVESQWSVPDYVNFVAEQAAGNFLYIRQYLTAIQRDLETGKTNLISADSVPEGLFDFYRVSLVDRVRGSVPDELWNRAFMPIIGCFAIAQEPLTDELLSRFTGIDASQVASVRNRLAEFLDEVRLAGRYAYRIYHASFAEYLVSPVLNRDYPIDAVAFHRQIASSYRPTDGEDWGSINWNTALIDDYAHRHLVKHLTESGEIASVLTLLGNRSWYESQLAYDATGSSWDLDASEARYAIAAADEKAVAIGGFAAGLVDEIRLSLLSTPLGTKWAGSTRQLGLLVRLGVLTGRQAVAIAAQLPGDLAKGLALGQILPYVAAEEVHLILERARLIDDPNPRSALLVKVAQRLADERTSLLAEALDAAQGIAIGRNKAEVLISITDAVQPAERPAVLRQAAETALGLATSIDRTRALAQLARRRDSPDLLESALSSVCDEASRSECIWCLMALLPLVKPERRKDLEDTAVAIAGEIERPNERLQLSLRVSSTRGVELPAELLKEIDKEDPYGLLGVVDQLEGPQRSVLLDYLKATVTKIPDPADRAQLLVHWAARLPPEAVKANVAEAISPYASATSEEAAIDVLLAVAQAIDYETRDPTVGEVLLALPWVTQPSSRERLQRARALILEMALETARSISDPLALARSYITIGPVLDDRQLDAAFRRAIIAPGAALVSGQFDKDDVERVELIADLAPQLDLAERERAIDQALSIARKVTREADRARALAAVLEHVSGRRREDIAGALLDIAPNLDPAAKAAVLTRALFSAPPEMKDKILELAVDSALASKPAAPGTAASMDFESGLAILNRDPENLGRPSSALLAIALQVASPKRDSLIEKAIDYLYDAPSAYQAVQISDLATSLSEAQLRRLLDDYRRLLLDPLRSAFLSRLDQALSDMEPPADIGLASVVAVDEQGMPENSVSRQSGEGTLTDGVTDYPFKITFPMTKDLSRLTKQQPAFQVELDSRIASLSHEDVDAATLTAVEITARDFAQYYDYRDLIECRYDAEELLGGTSWMRAIGALLARLAQLASPQQALHEAESIWGAIPALVVAEIGSVTPSDDLVALAADALTDVDALTDPLERAELRIGLLPLLRGAERSDLIERIAHDLKEVDDGEAVAAHLERLQRVAPDCPPSVTLRLFQQICVSTPSRELLVAVRELLPALESIGGPDLPADLAHMVTASTSSW